MIEAEREFQEGKASKQVKADDGSEEIFDKTRGTDHFIMQEKYMISCVKFLL